MRGAASGVVRALGARLFLASFLCWAFVSLLVSREVSPLGSGGHGLLRCPGLLTWARSRLEVPFGTLHLLRIPRVPWWVVSFPPASRGPLWGVRSSTFSLLLAPRLLVAWSPSSSASGFGVPAPKARRSTDSTRLDTSLISRLDHRGEVPSGVSAPVPSLPRRLTCLPRCRLGASSSWSGAGSGYFCVSLSLSC